MTRLHTLFGVALAMAVALPSQAREEILVPRGDKWWFLDTGKHPGVGWQTKSVPQPGWKEGRGQLGYGDLDERALVSFGPDAGNKFITTYFAKSFTVADPSKFRALKLRGILDDGAVVYLNGQEIWRFNMPAGTIGNDTPATVPITDVLEDVFFLRLTGTRHLKAGANILAVEVHQFSPVSADVSFDLEVLGSDGRTSLLRGPYLQLGTPTSVVVRWRTDSPEDAVVWHGTSPTNLTRQVVRTTKSFLHEAKLTGLAPNTRYYYAVGTSTGVLAGADAEHWFVTAPARGKSKPTRVWVLGDSGTRDFVAAAVRDGYKKFTGNRHTDLWLMLGDNAYVIGRDVEYQEAVFEMYPDMLRKSVLWPTIGNHDAFSATSSSQTGVYYSIFTLPTKAEAGGLASGTEAYYSFDYGNVHFVCLDSEGSDRARDKAMLKWVERDLANTTATWIVAFFHQPPYSKGSHDSDNDLEVQMQEMRANALPVLEAGGVDLVLTGHSHSYERSYLLDGHYGKSTTLTAAMIVDPGDGRVGGDGEYRKSAGPHSGAVYAVAGSSGKVFAGQLDHPAMVVSMAALGSMVLDFDDDRLDAKFVDFRGVVRDSFTLEKGEGRTLRRDRTSISLATGGAQKLELNGGRGGALYIVAGSFGTTPGFSYRGAHVPLNPDPWFSLTLQIANSSFFDRFVGLLDGNGRATATVRLPPTSSVSLVGAAVHHAAIVFDAGLRPKLVSNWERLRFVK